MQALKQTEAYDLSLFDEKIISINDRSQRAKISKKNETMTLSFTRVALFAAVVAMVVAILFSYSQITEIGAQVNSLNKDLGVLQEEEKRLNALLENKTSLKNIEAYAVTELGMVDLKSHQITYLMQQSDDKVEVLEEESTGILLLAKNIQKTLDSALAYFN